MAHAQRQSGAARRVIRRFVASTAFTRRFWFAAASLVTHGLGVGVLLYLIDWAVPAWNSMALLVGLSWLGAVVVWHIAHRGMSLPAADGALGLQDRLRTWWSLREAEDAPAVAWLEQDLRNSLESLPAGKRGQLWRRPMRRLLWLLPLLIVVWIFGPLGRQLILPSPFGVTEQTKIAPKAKQKPKTGAQKIAKKDRPEAKKPPQDPKPDQKKPKPKPTKPERDQPPPERREPENKKPQPILPLPAQKSFVIPDFIGDGASKKKKTTVAEVEETELPRAADPSSAAGAVGEKRDEEKLLDFKRAAERAQEARHVPVPERGMVRRYFESLTKPPPAAKESKPPTAPAPGDKGGAQDPSGDPVDRPAASSGTNKHPAKRQQPSPRPN